MYALVRLKRQRTGGSLRHVLYGVCGNRRLLEKICAGQEHPEEWRVSSINRSSAYKRAEPWRKAG